MVSDISLRRALLFSHSPTLRREVLSWPAGMSAERVSLFTVGSLRQFSLVLKTANGDAHDVQGPHYCSWPFELVLLDVASLGTFSIAGARVKEVCTYRGIRIIVLVTSVGKPGVWEPIEIESFPDISFLVYTWRPPIRLL